YDEDLKALTAKARQLKARKQSQLGELVEATGANAMPIEELAGALLSIAAITDPQRREAWRKRGAAFFLARGPNRRLASALATTRNQQRRTSSARHRLALQQARHDTRAWQVKRKERTRLLIELGGLIAKAGLVELTDDDRAVILGLLVEAAAKLRTDETGTQLALWRRRGKRAFADTEDKD
ncbi:conjugal transfer protein TraD, partial [Novosphingobium sp. B-7]|uniref:conjugal transfer protein TraD n=1 Tax=Novosphingobium sp. B-7 TaxID=1298855 RepID=UPI001ED9A13A